MTRSERIGLVFTVVLLGLTGTSYEGVFTAPTDCPVMKIEPESMTCETSEGPGFYVCFNEGGVSLQSASIIRYNLSQLQVASKLGYLSIVIEFATRKLNSILLQLRSAEVGNSNYLSLEINNRGGIKLYIDVGFDELMLNSDFSDEWYADGLPHRMLLEINVTNDWPSMASVSDFVHLQVDENHRSAMHSERVLAEGMMGLMTKPGVCFIGNNDTSNQNNAFVGLILVAKIGDVDLLPLAFLPPQSSIVQLTGLDRRCLSDNSSEWAPDDAPPCSGRKLVVPARPAVYGFCQVSSKVSKDRSPKCSGLAASYVDTAALTGRQYSVCTPEVGETTTTTTTTTGSPPGGTTVSSCPGTDCILIGPEVSSCDHETCYPEIVRM